MSLRRLLSSTVALAVVFAAGAASAADIPMVRPMFVTPTVRMQWDRNSEPDLAGYRLYYGTDPQTFFGYMRDVGLDTSVVLNLTGMPVGPTGRLWAVVSAYDDSGNESDVSSAVSIVFTPDSSGWLFGDQNGDGRVDVLDHALFFSTFGRQVGDAGFLGRMDYDADGRIDGIDHTAFTQNYGAVR